ncbi:DNA starvation/stationary phase protection protein Dps, partial [Pectobacterium versatile]|nr:DNA starvation/stationary phase protection protein Dps [Pectobacterium versatile]
MRTAKLVKAASADLIFTRNDLDDNVKASTIALLNQLVV